MKRTPQGTTSRARWAAIGAAIAVSLGAGGVAVTNAIVSTGERAVFIPIAPCRLFDLRPAPDLVGPRSAPLGPGETFTQAVRGTNGNCTIPADATAVSMNVTAVGGTAASFLTIWPSDVAPRPLASNLNWVPGSAPTPNKVDVKLAADGSINLFNLTGSVVVLADVVGYYADHNHDDRYFTETETDVKRARIASSTVAGFPTLSDGETLTTVALTVTGTTQLVYLSGQASIFTNSTQGVTCTSTSSCNLGIEIFDADTNTRLTPLNGSFFRLRDDFDGQSLSIAVVVSAAVGTHNYRLQTEFNAVNAEVPFLNNASLTAMTVPLNGAGIAPLSILPAPLADAGFNPSTG